ncbi:hypothetical protein BU015_02000 [Staphylococcus simulans]|nr:hypothetical protein BU015_02000 [Staphylococcus simulans]
MVLKKMIKILLIVIICILVVLLSAVIYFKSTQRDFTQQEVKQLVDDRYDGKVQSIALNKAKTTYKVKMLDEGLKYDLEVDKKDGTIKNVHTEKIKQSSQSKSKPKKTTKEKKTPYISEETAKAVAQHQVPGQFVYIDLEKEHNPPFYTVQQIVDDDEGAIIKVNALNKKVLSVSWFEIKDDDDDDFDD